MVPWQKKEDEETQKISAKLKFIQILIQKEKYQIFKETMKLNEKYNLLATPLFSFLENYGTFLDMFNNEMFIPTLGYASELIDPNLFVIKKFCNPLLPKPPIRRRKVPDIFSSQILRFYAIFLVTDGPLEVPFLPKSVRATIAEQLLTLTDECDISNDIFDPVATLVLDTLFSRCFPKFLSVEGQSMAIMKRITNEHKEWAQSIEISPSIEIYNPAVKKLPKNYKLNATRECMVLILQGPDLLYNEFTSFVSKHHCEENLILFESFTKLEMRTRKYTNLSPSMARFLKTDVPDNPDEPVEIDIFPLFLFFYRMFIRPNSQFEVNVTHHTRKEIEMVLSEAREKMIKVSLFDKVIDHVLELLYLNSFIPFVKTKET